jgi:hypothetical protein
MQQDAGAPGRLSIHPEYGADAGRRNGPTSLTFKPCAQATFVGRSTTIFVLVVDGCGAYRNGTLIVPINLL